MELLADSFSAAFSVSSDPNDTAAPHPRIGDYKVKPLNVPDQYVRRQRKLEQQKKKRHDAVNYSRKLADGNLEEDDLGAICCEDMDATSTEEYKSRRKKFNPYAYQLMLSEWLVDVPDDLAEEWLMVVCPVGKRNLIIAANGTTSAYTKSGFRVNKFTSQLPGGSPQTLKPGEYSILDCIFCEVSNIFYVLDVMCWRGHPVFDTETEFRFYWLQTKLQETPSVTETSSSNPYKFTALPYYGCTPASLEVAVNTSTPFQVDGMLFFHKRTHYSHGRTPLVGWLKPHMLPEILGIPVSPEIMSNAPTVNKLTLLNANKDLKDTTDDKTAEEKAAVVNTEKDSPEKMETERKHRKGRKKKSSNGVDKVEDSSVQSESLDMDVEQKSRRRRRRRKKKTEEMCVEEAPADIESEEKLENGAELLR